MFASVYCRNVSAEPSANPPGPSGFCSLPEFVYAFSPLVEEVDPETVVIDVEGCTLRFGSHYELAKQIARQAQSKEQSGLGRQVNVALAANPDAAIHAAKFYPGITFTAAGEELTCLGSLPLTALQYSLVGLEEKQATEILETLTLWGVGTFQEFAALPVKGVSERLGQAGVRLQQLARGKTDRHLNLKQSPPIFENSIELDYAISEAEPLSFILARLLNQICAALNAHALATNALKVKLKLETGATHELTLTLPYPMRDHKVFLKLLAMETEKHPPQSAVVAVWINCEPVKPRLLQTGLFIPLAPEPEKLELLLARLARLVGTENIGSPELLDTHRPDAFRLNRFELKDRRRVSKKKTADRMSALPAQSRLGFRVFRPALRAIVQAYEGCPREISAWDQNRSVYGKVVSAAGPWRTSGDWWRSDLWARDEWDIGVESQAGNRPAQFLYRVFRELRNGAWFVEGVYD